MRVKIRWALFNAANWCKMISACETTRRQKPVETLSMHTATWGLGPVWVNLFNTIGVSGRAALFRRSCSSLPWNPSSATCIEPPMKGFYLSLSSALPELCMQIMLTAKDRLKKDNKSPVQGFVISLPRVSLGKDATANSWRMLHCREWLSAKTPQPTASMPLYREPLSAKIRSPENFLLLFPWSLLQ